MISRAIKHSQIVLFMFGLFSILNACTSSKIEEKKPNIIFLFADDMSFNTLNLLKEEGIKTPNLDRLGQSGVQFTNAFNMGGWNGAICTASRTMMLTGRSIWNAYDADSLMKTGSYKDPFLSEILAEQGYDTYISGKWHIRKSADSVFSIARHIRPGMPNQTPEGYNRPLSESDTLWRPWDTSKEGFWKNGKHWSEVLADDAADFISMASEKENPFFMYLAFNAPHDPRQSPKKFVDLYPLEDISIPENFLPEYPYKTVMESDEFLRDEQLAPFPRTHHAVRVHLQEYYAIITHMDEQIGKILNELEASGKMENTIVVFSADHGLSVGQHGLLGKQNMYDHSIRVPLLIAGPGIPKAEQRTGNIYLQDLMPTFLELSKSPKPDYVDFRSILPIIQNERTENYKYIYGAYIHAQRMIRSNDYKLISYPKGNIIRLFDLKKDPWEKNDLASEPEFVPIKDKLWTQLLQLQREMRDPIL